MPDDFKTAQHVPWKWLLEIWYLFLLQIIELGHGKELQFDVPPNGKSLLHLPEGLSAGSCFTTPSENEFMYNHSLIGQR